MTVVASAPARAAAPARRLFDELSERDAARRTAERSGSRQDSDGGRLTLDQRLASVWEGLLAAGAAECPLCGGSLRHKGAAARCGGCGSSLS